MVTIFTANRGEVVQGARELPDWKGVYILTDTGDLYRVRPYIIHTVKEGWQKRVRIRVVTPRGRAKMVCLSYQGKRRDVALSTLVKEVFG
jgi:hypothetical protein